MVMLREAALKALVTAALCGPASAGVLSATDIQRLRDYEQFVIPADQEIPQLRDMEVQITRLIAMVEGSVGPVDDSSRSDFRFVVSELPVMGGPSLERMVSSLRVIQNPDVFAPPEWATILTEVQAEIEERLAYDTAVLKAYQRSVAAGAPGLGTSFTRWEERPDHWSRFQAALDRSQSAVRRSAAP
jgi:hypothetical protein